MKSQHSRPSNSDKPIYNCKLQKFYLIVAINIPDQKINSQEYTNDVYQALERGKLFGNMYFKRIQQNSVIQLKTKPDWKKSDIENKLEQIFMEYLPEKVLDCDKIQLPEIKNLSQKYIDRDN